MPCKEIARKTSTLREKWGVTLVSKIKLNRFDKGYLIVVLIFILAIGTYDLSYSRSNRQTKNEDQSNSTSTQVDSKTEEQSNSESQTQAKERARELAEEITTPVATNATMDEEIVSMKEYSSDYADDITTYTVAEIADQQASELGTDAETTLNQLIEALPANVNLTSSQYQMVNKLNPLVEEPTFEPAYTANGLLYNAAITDAYTNLLVAAQEAGYTLSTISAHRTIAYQEQNVINGYNIYLSQGSTAEEARALTNAYYAPAQASEHSTGLAFDLLGTEWTSIGGSLVEEYAGQPSAQWLADNAQDYGFILRYPEGKEQVTGYSFEPWHYRYVGVEPAQYIAENNLTLEEFYALVNYRTALENE